MHYEPMINGDMASEQRESMMRPQSELGFYLVASNRELLNHVESIMNRRGLFGVLDSNGRVHYLVDARKGSPYAARQIMSTTDRLANHHLNNEKTNKMKVRTAVARVLNRYDWNVQLRGYRLLGDILRMTAVDVSLLNPISKRLYPEIAARQKLKSHQIERNIRYLFDDLALRELQEKPMKDHSLLIRGEISLPVGRTIARLTEEVREALDHLKECECDDLDIDEFAE